MTSAVGKRPGSSQGCHAVAFALVRSLRSSGLCASARTAVSPTEEAIWLGSAAWIVAATHADSLGGGRLAVVVAHLGLVLDCHDPETLATFWSQALGYDLIGGAGSYVLLLPAGGEAGPQLLLQRVPEPKQTKNRMHFDIHVVDIEAEASRLVGLGAARVRSEALSEHGNNWVLLRDPEGNEFCVCDGGSGA